MHRAPGAVVLTIIPDGSSTNGPTSHKAMTLLLRPIVFAAAIWGEEWEEKSILCRCDNEAVVHIINTGTSRDPVAMGLMRCLFFISAKYAVCCPHSGHCQWAGRCIIPK